MRVHRPLNRERDLDRPSGQCRRTHDPVGIPTTPRLRCSLTPLARLPHPCAPEPAPVGTPGALKAELRERQALDRDPTLDDVFLDATGRTRSRVAGDVQEVK